MFLREVLVNFLTEIAHIDVHDIRVRIEVLVPHVFQQLPAREHLALMPHHILEKSVFLDTEVHDLVTSLCLMRGGIELKISTAQGCLLIIETGATQKRFNASNKLRKLKGLDEIVVGTDAQSSHDVVCRVEGCEHEQGRL